MNTDGRELEVIYVDSNSRDGSVSIARSYGATVIALDAVRCTAALARNAGWQAARNELVLFLDGDTVLHPQFLPAAVNALTERTAVVWGHRREASIEVSIYNRVLDLDWIYPPGYTEFCGGDALMRRSVLAEVSGFDASLIAGEEPELCRRMVERGYSIVHIDVPMTSHDLAITSFRQYWQRARRAGYAYAEISERFRNSASPFWLREADAIRMHGVALLAAPMFAVLSACLLGSGMPVLLLAGLISALLVRTVWRARWKSRSALTLAAYALHSHLQMLPLCAGQCEYFLRRRTAAGRDIIEYKEAKP
jgi:cellulose synthase/poly-beta-1,6-N-acetylglucosamine synthase-like glycosyltransferase